MYAVGQPSYSQQHRGDQLIVQQKEPALSTACMGGWHCRSVARYWWHTHEAAQTPMH